MKNARTRHRRTLVLAACAAGLVVSMSACRPQTIYCPNPMQPVEIPAGTGK
jgi:hypothetical protein